MSDINKHDTILKTPVTKSYSFLKSLPAIFDTRIFSLNASYLVVEPCDLLLTGRGQKERVHLRLQSVVHFHIDIITRSLLLIVGVHAETEFQV